MMDPTLTDVLPWPYGHGYNAQMKTLAAGKFKDVCLQTLDEVASTRRPVVILRLRGRTSLGASVAARRSR